MASELGSFLRARRTDPRLRPEHPSLGVRRVSGLRREEVAAAAGISIDYYTRLEQGRETNPSDAVLRAVARVLHLKGDSLEYLFLLRSTPEAAVPTVHGGMDLRRRSEALVAAVRPNPAYVLDRLSNVLAINAEGLALLDGLESEPADARNMCTYLLTHARAREIFVDWEDIARGAVAQLRAANAGNLREARLQELVDQLAARSSRFAGWWSGHLVGRRRSSTKRLRTNAGEVERQLEILQMPDEGLRMTLWLPASAASA